MSDINAKVSHMKPRRVQPPPVKTCMLEDFENRLCVEVESEQHKAEEDVATLRVELPPSDDMLGLNTAFPTTSLQVEEAKARFLTQG